MTRAQIDKELKRLEEAAAPHYKALKAIEEEVKTYRAQKKEAIKKAKFKWNEKEYKVSAIHWYEEWNYDNCPYTPGYMPGGETIEFKQDGEPDFRRVWFIDSSSCGEGKKKGFTDFQEFFKKKFGVSLGSIVEKERRNNR